MILFCLVALCAAWYGVNAPRRNFRKYFGVNYPISESARMAVAPLVVNRLHELHSALPERESQDLNQQINDLEPQLDVQKSRDLYFRLLGRRDELIKESQPRYDTFNGACQAGAEALISAIDSDTDRKIGNLFRRAGCSGYGDGAPF